MAIEQLGESLLSNIRARNDQIARQNRKIDRKEALMALGTKLAVGVGNQMLSDKASEFLENEQFLASNALFKSAVAAKTDLASERKKIDESGLSELAYYEKQFRPQFETLYKENMGDLDQFGTQVYDAQITEEVRKLAQQRADAFLNAELAASKIKSPETISAEAAKAISKARPTDVGSFITRGITSLFSGKDQKQRDQEALAAIIKYNPNREFAINAKKEFDRTDNLLQAFNYATLVTPKTEDKDRYQESTTYDVQIRDDVAYLVEKTISKDRFQVKPDIQGKPKVSRLLDLDEKTKAANILKAAQSNYNLAEKPSSLLTTTAYAQFVEEVGDAGIILSNIQTFEEYTKVATILQDFTKKEVNLKDPEKAKTTAAAISALVSNSIPLQRALTLGNDEDLVLALERLNSVQDIISDMTKGSYIAQSTNAQGDTAYVLYDADGTPLRVIDPDELDID